MPQAEAYEREALELSTRLVGRHDLRTLEMIGDLGTIVDLEGKAIEAEPYYNEFSFRRAGAQSSESPQPRPGLELQRLASLPFGQVCRVRAGDAQRTRSPHSGLRGKPPGHSPVRERA
jgi:hypothetical protein